MKSRTTRKEKIIKMPIYARYEVSYFWLVDPFAKTLDVLRLQEGNWVVAGVYLENDKVRAMPFEEIEIDLSELWIQPESQGKTS